LPAEPRKPLAHPARTAAFIYGGVSAIGAVVFLLLTTFTGDYPAVARYGGAAWIFLLLMIVLMPIVIPPVQKRSKKMMEPPGPQAGEPIAMVACPLETPAPQPGGTETCTIEGPPAS
jgi:hypothetical protein